MYRNTKQRIGDVRGYLMKGSAVCEAGNLAMLNAGYAQQGATATGLIAIGRIEETVDNSAGSDGDATVKVRQGEFKFDNSGADAITQADVGKACYCVNATTVARTTGTNTRSRVGVITGLDADGGIWVSIGLGV